MIEKKEIATEPPPSSTRIVVTLEPLKGHTANEVANRVREAGAVGVKVMGSKFIRARMEPSAIPATKHFARVHVNGPRCVSP